MNLDPGSDPIVRGTDPRIRIRSKMSRIRGSGSVAKCHGSGTLLPYIFFIVGLGNNRRRMVFYKIMIILYAKSCELLVDSTLRFQGSVSDSGLDSIGSVDPD